MKPIKMCHRLLLVVIAALALSGCAVPPKEVIVEKIHTVYVTVPKNFTKPVIPGRPMERSQYLSLPLEEREQEANLYAKTLLKDLSICNAQLHSIDKQFGPDSTAK